MSYECKILADSISLRGHRLTTFECTFPRIVLPEMLTHRVFSRNTASSRAIPVLKQIEKVRVDPFVPESFGKNQKGMVATTELSEKLTDMAQNAWQSAVDHAVQHAKELEYFQVHKQLANRIIEPYTWTTQIITATDWDNFFKLRLAEDAQPEIRTIAEMMEREMVVSVPIEGGGWHLPLVDENELFGSLVGDDPIQWDYWKKVSIGRCARVSYLTHDGQRDPDADIELYNRLWKSGHLSPFEHVARSFTEDEWDNIQWIQKKIDDVGLIPGISRYQQKQLEYVGNLRGWVSVRMELENGI